jgi:hypothetical protein
MKKISLILMISLVVCQSVVSQNIGISSNGATPAASAMLDIVSTTKGLLIPRVALTATNVAGPVTSPATSLLVYNTATAGTSPDNVIPGYYYWNGSAWISFLTATTTGWTVTGNSGTTAGTNFIGTTDDEDLVFKTDNVETMRLYSGGGVDLDAGIGTGTDAGSAIYAIGDYNNYLEINVQNLNNGNLASSDIVATADNGDSLSVYVDMGINSGGYSNGGSNILNGANVAYLYAHGRDFKIGNGSPNRNLIFFTNPSGGTLGTNTANGVERMRISQNGNVGIGISNPNYLLQLGSNSAAKPGSDAWTIASDRRLKKDIRPFEDGLGVLKKINPVWYQYNGLAQIPNDGKNYVGIIAQEMQLVAPYTIGFFKDPETNTEYLNYDSNALTYILINSIKEQQAEIEALTKQLEAQHQRLLRLEEKLK